MVRLRACYDDAGSLLRDHDQQFRRGGLLVRLDPLPEAALFESVELELVTPFGGVIIAAQVIQMLPGMGLAVGFSPESAPGLTRIIAGAQAAGVADANGQPSFSLVTGNAEASETPGDPTGDQASRVDAPMDARTKIRSASATEKMQIALHGNKEERTLLLRDGNRLLHQYVLKNPKIQIDEVANIAGMRTVAPELLKRIASRREWAQRPEVALALVRNPKTPVPLAVKLVDYVPVQHLRQLAKQGGVRVPIQRAARKKVVG